MAIFFDSAAHVYTPGNGSNLSTSVTNSGGNLMIVGFWIGLGTGAPTLTTVTYNGVAMTQIPSQTASIASQIFYVYYLVNPAKGANTLAISHTGGGNCYTYAYVATYSGVDTSNPIDATTSTDLS